jgi:hypothetical protein
MKVIIAGSRSISDIKLVELAIFHADFEITEVVSGGAGGVDRLGENWAYRNKIHIQQFIPKWKKIINNKTVVDKTAGFARNREMGDYADALIAVWDNYSSGTAQMIEYMNRLKKPVCIYNVKKNTFLINNRSEGNND